MKECVNILISRVTAKVIETQNTEGNTPLHIAASKSNPDIVSILLSNGASVYSINKKGKSPLDIAGEVLLQNDDIVKLLLVELLAFILKNKKTFESKKFQDYLGYGSNMFHLKSGLLKYIVDQSRQPCHHREIK